MNKKQLLTGVLGAAALAAAVLAAPEAPNMRNTSFADAVPNENDIIFDPAKTYGDFYLNKDGTFEDPIIVWGNGAKLRCVLLHEADYVVFKDTYVDGCDTFGIRSTGDHVQLLNNVVTNAVRMNLNKITGKCGSSTSWHAGVRVADAIDILVEGNTANGICGEAIAGLRIDGAIFRNNIAKNGFSVNFYCDQCLRTVIEGNTSVSDDPNYYKDGKPARGISIGAESYAGHPFTVGNILIEGNTLEGTRGINFIQEQSGTPSNVVVRDNVFVNVPAPLVALGSWATVSNSYTATPSGITSVPTLTPSKTPTVISSRTATVPVPSRTPTLSPTLTAVPTICETAVSERFWFMGCTK